MFSQLNKIIDLLKQLVRGQLRMYQEMQVQTKLLQRIDASLKPKPAVRLVVEAGTPIPKS